MSASWATILASHAATRGNTYSEKERYGEALAGTHLDDSRTVTPIGYDIMSRDFQERGNTCNAAILAMLLLIVHGSLPELPSQL